jgi:hypothetical protein
MVETRLMASVQPRLYNSDGTGTCRDVACNVSTTATATATATANANANATAITAPPLPPLPTSSPHHRYHHYQRYQRHHRYHRYHRYQCHPRYPSQRRCMQRLYKWRYLIHGRFVPQQIPHPLCPRPVVGLWAQCPSPPKNKPL